MKKPAIFLVLLLLWANASPAQQEELDSLLNILRNQTHHDTVRINLLTEITFLYAGLDPEKGLDAADEAIALAEKVGYKEKLASAYNYKAINFSSLGNDSLALELYISALNIHKSLGNLRGIGSALHNIGLLYYGLSDHFQALEYHRKALEVFKEAGLKRGTIASLNSIGVNYMSLSDYPKALTFYLEALSLIDESDPLNLANAYTNLGIVYKNLSKYATALEYHNKALEIYQRHDNQRGMADVLGNLGVAYDLMGNASKASEVYQTALEISEKIGNVRGVASNLINMGIIFADQGNEAKAWGYFHRAFSIYKQTGSKNNMSIALNYIGSLILKAPDIFLEERGIPVGERFKKAEEVLSESLQLATESASLESQASAWQSLTNIFEAQKDFSRALHAYRQYMTLRDSIFNEEKTEEIARREIAYTYDKKEALLKAEHENHQLLAAAEIQQRRMEQYTILGGAALLLLVAISGFIFYKKKRDTESLLREAAFRVQVSETEMKALRTQMNPHFIFNSLNSINDFIGRHDTRTVENYLTKFAKVIRMTLEHSEQKAVSLSQDLQALELYMQLEAIRLNNKFSYQIKVDENIDRENTLVPSLLLQPFVENSIWHGISKMEGKGMILIYILNEGDMLKCIVEDNGIGRNISKLSQPSANGHTRLGMKITDMRLQILSAVKKSKASVTVTDLAQGTRVEVKLPLELYV